MTSPSIHDLPTTDVSEPEILFDKGDIALVIKPDGSVNTLSFSVDTSVMTKPEEELTDEDWAVLRQGQIAYALSLAARSDAVIELLIQVASDPEVTNYEALKQAALKH